MNNIMRSDTYRLKKSNTFLTVTLVTVGLIALMWALTATTNILYEKEFAELAQNGYPADEEILNLISNKATSFMTEIMGQNFMVFIFLAVVIAVFCEDYTQGTVKNTLSFESNRNTVYFSKLSLSVITCFALKIVSFITALVISLLFIPEKDFSVAFFAQIGISFLLQIPSYLALISIIFALIAFTKKSGATMAAFIFATLGISMVAQFMSSVFPKLATWLPLLDGLQVPALLIQYQTLGKAQLVIATIGPLAIFAGLTYLTLKHFKKSDFS